MFEVPPNEVRLSCGVRRPQTRETPLPFQTAAAPRQLQALVRQQPTNIRWARETFCSHPGVMGISHIIGIVGDAGNAVCVNAKPQLDSETVLSEGKDPTLVLSERPIGLSERGSGGESC